MDLRKRDTRNLSVCQMIKNIICTRMEMRKKNKKRGFKVVSKLAKKLVQKQKSKTMKNKCLSTNKSKTNQNRFMVDLNVNVKLTK